MMKLKKTFCWCLVSSKPLQSNCNSNSVVNKAQPMNMEDIKHIVSHFPFSFESHSQFLYFLLIVTFS